MTDAPKMYEAGLFWLDRKKYVESTAAFTAALEAQRLLLPVGRKELPTDTTVGQPRLLCFGVSLHRRALSRGDSPW